MLWNKCNHEKVKRRWFTASNGARHLRDQCLICGRDPRGFFAYPHSDAEQNTEEWDYAQKQKYEDDMLWVNGFIDDDE